MGAGLQLVEVFWHVPEFLRNRGVGKVPHAGIAGSHERERPNIRGIARHGLGLTICLWRALTLHRLSCGTAVLDAHKGEGDAPRFRLSYRPGAFAFQRKHTVDLCEEYI